MMVQLDAAARRSNVDFSKIEVGGEAAGAVTGSGASASASASATGAKPAPGQTVPPPGSVQVGNGGFSAMPFSFAFKGNFFNLSNFFSKLERFVSVRNEKINVTGRLLRLESITLAPDTTGFPHIKAEVNAATYLMTPPQLGGGAPSGGAAKTTPPAGQAPAGGTTPPLTTATATGAAR
jgi:hypothetical protein